MSLPSPDALLSKVSSALSIISYGDVRLPKSQYWSLKMARSIVSSCKKPSSKQTSALELFLKNYMEQPFSGALLEQHQRKKSDALTSVWVDQEVLRQLTDVYGQFNVFQKCNFDVELFNGLKSEGVLISREEFCYLLDLSTICSDETELDMHPAMEFKRFCEDDSSIMLPEGISSVDGIRLSYMYKMRPLELVEESIKLSRDIFRSEIYKGALFFLKLKDPGSENTFEMTLSDNCCGIAVECDDLRVDHGVDKESLGVAYLTDSEYLYKYESHEYYYGDKIIFSCDDGGHSAFYELFLNRSSKGRHIGHPSLIKLKQQIDMNIIEFMRSEAPIWEVLSDYNVDFYYLIKYIEKSYGYKFDSLMQIDCSMAFKSNCVNYLGYNSRATPNGVSGCVLLLDAMPDVEQRGVSTLEFVINNTRWEYCFDECQFSSQIGVFKITQKDFLERFVQGRSCNCGGGWSEVLLLAMCQINKDGVSMKELSKKFRKSLGNLSKKLSYIYDCPEHVFISNPEASLFSIVYGD